MTTPTRTGKIARLPHKLRDRLNTRLKNGESARTLIAWLNARTDVKAILKQHFDAQPIREQNLSQWRHGGYQDWLLQQNPCDLSHTVNGDHTAWDNENAPLPSALNHWVATHYTLITRRIVQLAQTDPDASYKLLRSMTRDVALLQRSDTLARREKRQDRHQAFTETQATERTEQARQKTEILRKKDQSDHEAWALAPENQDRLYDIRRAAYPELYTDYEEDTVEDNQEDTTEESAASHQDEASAPGHPERSAGGPAGEAQSKAERSETDCCKQPAGRARTGASNPAPSASSPRKDHSSPASVPPQANRLPYYPHRDDRTPEQKAAYPAVMVDSHGELYTAPPKPDATPSACHPTHSATSSSDQPSTINHPPLPPSPPPTTPKSPSPAPSGPVPTPNTASTSSNTSPYPTPPTWAAPSTPAPPLAKITQPSTLITQPFPVRTCPRNSISPATAAHLLKPSWTKTR